MTAASNCESVELLRLPDAVARALHAAHLHARRHWFISIDEDAIWKQVRIIADRSRIRGPLGGMVVAVKDQLDVAGEMTTCGTRFYRRRATNDAAVVASLRAAGAVVFGKTNMHELALGPTGRNAHYGDAANPWDPARDTGGSSSGSAAVVAAGLVDLAVGTDLGGSIRIPASFCGVPSIKPSFDAISTTGVVPVSPTLEHVGLIGKDVATLAAGFRVVTTSTLDSSPTATRGIRIGISEDWWARASPQVRATARRALDRLNREQRVEIRMVRLPSLDEACAIGALLSTCEAATTWGWALEAYGRFHRAKIGEPIKVALAIGREVRARERERAERARQRFHQALERVFEEVDLIASPATSSAAPPYRDDGTRGEIDEAMVMERIAFTMPYNLTGHPAVQVPCGFGSDDMPIGLQLAARRGADAKALEVARLVESAAERRRPQLAVDR